MRTRLAPGRKGYDELAIAEIGQELENWLRDMHAVSEAGEVPAVCGTLTAFKTEYGYSDGVVQRAKIDLLRRSVPLVCKMGRGHYIGQPFGQVTSAVNLTKRIETQRKRVNSQLIAMGDSKANGAALQDFLSQCLSAQLSRQRVVALLQGGDEGAASARVVQLMLSLPAAN